MITPLYDTIHAANTRNTKTAATNGLASTGILSIKFNIDKKFKGSIFLLPPYKYISYKFHYVYNSS